MTVNCLLIQNPEWILRGVLKKREATLFKKRVRAVSEFRFDEVGVPRPQRLSKLSLAMAGGAQLVMYYTYILKSINDKNLYIGFTDNLVIRVSEHEKGLVNSTKYRRPLKLVYYEACLSKQKAIKREKYFKTGFGRKFLKDRI